MAVGLNSCKRDKDCTDPTNPDCENYNPCHNSKKLTADFDIYKIRNYRSNWIPYDTDSIFAIDARFVAKETGMQYEWTIGTETINTQAVTRKNFPIGVGIPITLRVKRKDGFECHPNDIFAVKTRIMRVVNFNDLRIEGCYQGANSDNPNDTFTVCIDILDSITFPNWIGKTTISGLINVSSCPKKTFIITSIEDLGYQQYIFHSSDGKCFSPRGRVRVDSAYTNSIHIDYSYFKSLQDLHPSIHKSFIGTRIN